MVRIHSYIPREQKKRFYKEKREKISITIKFYKMSDKTKQILKIVLSAIAAAIGAILAALGLQSCNVTRVITNESAYYQKGDTAVSIQTKTIESYNATKNK